VKQALHRMAGRMQETALRLLIHGPFNPSTGSGRTGVHTVVTPAKAGVQSSACDVLEKPWIPAFAGMTGRTEVTHVSDRYRSFSEAAY